MQINQWRHKLQSQTSESVKKVELLYDQLSGCMQIKTPESDQQRELATVVNRPHQCGNCQDENCFHSHNLYIIASDKST